MSLAGYLSAIAAHLGPLEASAVEFVNGQFHDVVLSADSVYRFPRTEPDRAAVPERAKRLGALSASGLGFNVPSVRYLGAMSEPLGRCFLAMERVSGGPLNEVPPFATEQVSEELQRVLTGLDSATKAVSHAIPSEPEDHWVQFAAQVEQTLFPLMSLAGRRRAAAELAGVRELPVPEVHVLCHGDLGGRNLLWEASSLRLSGVIDWDSVSLTSPAADVASLAATFGWPIAGRAASCLQNFDAVMAAARAIRATFALQQALPAALTNDRANLDDGLREYR